MEELIKFIDEQIKYAENSDFASDVQRHETTAYGALMFYEYYTHGKYFKELEALWDIKHPKFIEIWLSRRS